MEITINNKTVDTQANNLNDLAIELALPQKGVAVAVDNKMIPRNEWDSFMLKEGAKVIIIKAACGG